MSARTNRMSPKVWTDSEAIAMTERAMRDYHWTAAHIRTALVAPLNRAEARYYRALNRGLDLIELEAATAARVFALRPGESHLGPKYAVTEMSASSIGCRYEIDFTDGRPSLLAYSAQAAASLLQKEGVL